MLKTLGSTSWGLGFSLYYARKVARGRDPTSQGNIADAVPLLRGKVVAR
ncbi:MAG TPA: hypothetical protein VFK05_03945 [Polyangiaceae bacterium]|nr:hypothetical protein [Polyangiaceae bacterium]